MTCHSAPSPFSSFTQADLKHIIRSKQKILFIINTPDCGAAQNAGPVKGADLIRLAFVTLGQHEFAYKPKYLEPVKMLGYLDDENESIRQAAALAFCRVLHRNARLQKAAGQKELNGYKVGCIFYYSGPFHPSSLPGSVQVLDFAELLGSAMSYLSKIALVDHLCILSV